PIALPKFRRFSTGWIELGQGVVARDVEGASDADRSDEIAQSSNNLHHRARPAPGYDGPHANNRAADRRAQKNAKEARIDHDNVDRLHRRDPIGWREPAERSHHERRKCEEHSRNDAATEGGENRQCRVKSFEHLSIGTADYADATKS